MKKIALSLATVMAISAAPAAADWNWNPEACGGNNFETCISGGLVVQGTSLIVTMTNLGPGTITGVGLWMLPAGLMPVSASTTLSGWNGGGSNDINGVVPDNDVKYAIGTLNGINDGLAVGNTATFTFVFASGTDMSFADDGTLGVGVHSQGGPGNCSTKLFVQDGSVANPFGGDPGTCVPVPEPSSMALLATGLAGLAFIGRRRQRDIEEDEA